jgi:peptidyl-prolyl cis-trans isomerase A (cyclophilin A)
VNSHSVSESRSARRAGRNPAVLALVALLAGGCDTSGCGAGPAATPGAGAGAGTKNGAAAGGSNELVVDGYRVILSEPTKRLGPTPSKTGDTARARELANLVRTPTSPDPEAGAFTLEEAVAGLGTDGTLVVEIGTDLGTMQCDLFADRTPNTVANFIGLARGLRPFWDARAGAWVKRPLYRDTTFHRVIPGYMIQGGDHLGDGTGTVGYTIPDEMRPDLRHDAAGLLCMANTASNENGGQFFLLDAAAPQLDGMNTYTVFGRCLQTDVISRIARVPQFGGEENRPRTPVRINRVVVRRVRGGAANATPTRPIAPAGQAQPRGASPPPGSLPGGPVAPQPAMPRDPHGH